jgi:hypothetical protein
MTIKNPSTCRGGIPSTKVESVRNGLTVPCRKKVPRQLVKGPLVKRPLVKQPFDKTTFGKTPLGIATFGKHVLW